MAKKKYYTKSGELTRKGKKWAARERRAERRGLLARRSLPSFKKNTTPTQRFELRVTERAKRAARFDPIGPGTNKIWIKRLNVARKKRSSTFMIPGYGSWKIKKRWNK